VARPLGEEKGLDHRVRHGTSFAGIGGSPPFGYTGAGAIRLVCDLMISRIEQVCLDKGLKMTDQRRVIAQVLSESEDHPDVEQVYRRATAIDPRISIATVYRTVRLFDEANIIARHDFGDGRARYEEMPSAHHDHLINLQSGQVVEFRNEEIEKLQHFIAEQLGYELVGHRLELYAVPRRSKPRTDPE
jgi:Fur family ferric uptake transcriptional regulator